MTDNEVKEVPAQAEESTATPKQYEVGYGKPPRSTQFKPGQSGNPKGRTKGSRNGIYTYIQRELNSSITLTDGSKITKEQGFARQLTNKALRGDMLTQTLNKAHFQWEMEELNDSYEHFKGVYQSAQTLPSAGQCAKYIDELNISEDEALKTIKELLLPLLFKR